MTAFTCTCIGSGMGMGTSQTHAPAPATMPATTTPSQLFKPIPHRPEYHPHKLHHPPLPCTPLVYATPPHPMQAVLEHMARAPTPASRVDVMAVVVHYLTQDGEGMWEVASAPFW